MTKRVSIIGAGPGGLAAAMILAKAGLEVEVFEQLDRVGGRTSTLEFDGFRFDLGPTFFLYPRPLERIFRSVGYDVQEEVPMIHITPQYRVVWGAGGEILATPDVAEMDRRVSTVAPRDRGGFAKFMASNDWKMARMQPVFERPFSHWREFLSASMLKALPAVWPGNSLHSYLKQFFSDPRILLTFSFQSKYLGMSPFTCPSLFSILAFMEYKYGVFHPIGGCGAVCGTMARIAGELGARIRLSDPVEQILFEGRQAVGVRARSGEHGSDSVIVNADFAQAMRSLVPDRIRRRWTDARIARKRFSCSCFMMYLGIRGRYEDMPHHNIYIAKEYERNLREIEELHVLSEDPSIYVQNACGVDPSLAPPGMSTLYVLAPVTHQHPNVDWSKERERFRRVALAQLPKLGFEGVEPRIRAERVVTPVEWEREYRIYRGATFNLAHNLGQMLCLRPHNRFEDLDSVYLVGGGTHPGSGLPVIFESARISSRLVLDDFGMDSAWLAPGPA
jgi:phytoene desaturase